MHSTNILSSSEEGEGLELPQFDKHSPQFDTSPQFDKHKGVWLTNTVILTYKTTHAPVEIVLQQRTVLLLQTRSSNTEICTCTPIVDICWEKGHSFMIRSFQQT